MGLQTISQPWGSPPGGGHTVKIRVPGEVLLEACKLAERVVPVRPVHPAVGQLLADAREGGCTVQATDLEVGLRLAVEAAL